MKSNFHLNRENRQKSFHREMKWQIFLSFKWVKINNFKTIKDIVSQINHFFILFLIFITSFIRLFSCLCRLFLRSFIVNSFELPIFTIILRQVSFGRFGGFTLFFTGLLKVLAAVVVDFTVNFAWWPQPILDRPPKFRPYHP